MRHARRIKNKLSQISLCERGAPACRGGPRTSVCPGRCALHCGQKTAAPSKRGAMKECLRAVWRRRVEDLSKRISDFTSQSAEHLHLRLSLIKPGKSLSFTSPPNSLSAAAVFFFTAGLMSPLSFLFFFFYPLTVPLPVCLKVLDFSSAEKEQARTGKMNDINGQPILPGTCDWDKWALLH